MNDCLNISNMGMKIFTNLMEGYFQMIFKILDFMI